MPGNISERTLLIVSDTAVHIDGDQQFVFEPVLREIESIADLFDKIIWLGCRVQKNTTVLNVNCNPKLSVVEMPPVNRKFLNPLFVSLTYPLFLFQILKWLPKATHIHIRAPSHPALLGILLSRWDKRRVYWHKYAGNWMSGKLSFTYKTQRDLLKNTRQQNIRITVNGKSGSNNPGILSFENPCFSENERLAALKIARQKDFSGKLKLLFVGALDANKGILNLLDAIADVKLPELYLELIVAGDGPLSAAVRQRIQGLKHIAIQFTGTINRKKLNYYYADAHILVVPSLSEGFPKVIAEAAAFGCIPVVTDISSISQYITHGKNGFLMKSNEPAVILRTLQELPGKQLKEVSRDLQQFTEKFTYEYFRERIKTEIYHIS